jgi:uncharacterized protein YfaT (DUF1175 family)
MSFTLKKAKKIVKRYQFLLGQEIADMLPIDHIAIAPVDHDKLKLFLNNFFAEEEGTSTVTTNGYERENVQIVVMHIDKIFRQIQYLDLDSFLSRNNLKRIY